MIHISHLYDIEFIKSIPVNISQMTIIYSVCDIILVVFLLMFLQHTQHTTVIISLSIIILIVIVNSWL